MSLPFQLAFRGLALAGLLTERCHPIKGDLVRIYFRLSEPPPLGWSYLFTNVWRGLGCPMRRQAGVDCDAIWIDCVPEELAADLGKWVEQAVQETNNIYQTKDREQAGDAARERQAQAQLYFKLQTLRQTLYPEPAPRSWRDFPGAKWWRRVFGPPMPPPPALPATVRPDFPHGCFDRAALSADGQSLELDYFDHDPDGVRFNYRYVLSPGAAPRLVCGFIHEKSYLDYEIPIDRLPPTAIARAKDWLAAQIAAQRDEPVSSRLPELLEYLNQARQAA